MGATIIIWLAHSAASLIASSVDTALLGTGIEAATAVTDQSETTVSTSLSGLVYLPLYALISMGATAFYLAAHDDLDAAGLSSLLHPHPFWKFLITYVLTIIVIFFGILLFVVPGIIFALMLLFTSFIVIDREFDPIAAMGESRRITRGHKWRLLGFVIVLILVNVLGALALGVGLLVSIPVSELATVHAYRILAAPKMAVRPAPAN